MTDQGLTAQSEEDAVHDAKKLSSKLAEHAVLVNVPLYVYCKEVLSIDAMKTLKGDRLITYTDSADFIKKEGFFGEERIALGP